MLDIPLSLEPMEAEPVDDLPDGPGWQFEPKFDGFRCLAFRDGETVALQSRRQKPLQRFFPEVAAACAALPCERFVLDGELIIPGQAFDVLQSRLHPAASRILKLSGEFPARFVAFDLLADADGHSLLEKPFEARRAALETLFETIGGNDFVLAEATRSPKTARKWLSRLGHGLDGIVAKRLDLPYRPGQRAMAKYKVWRTVDCVVGGLYLRANGTVEYLLLGLWDGGRLRYIGRCGPPPDADALKALAGGDGFVINAPGGRSRWTGRARAVTPVRPERVAEVSADHIEAGAFRHGSRFLRWREDKAADRCTMDQIQEVA